MSQRAWFFVNQGQSSGPLTDAQLRTLLTSGTLNRDTLVWTDGMADWRKAGDAADLWTDTQVPPISTTSDSPAADAAVESGPLTIDVSPWVLVGRGLLCALGFILVIPAPWAISSYCRWVVSCIRVPGRPNLSFTGQPGDIWYVFVAMALLQFAAAASDRRPELAWVRYAQFPVQSMLTWLSLRWFVSHLASDGVPLPLTFQGSPAAYLGWQVVYTLSIFTIVGWAWVGNAFTRWQCQQVAGTRRHIEFRATGWETLWRTVVTALACLLVLPIPWVLRRFLRWYVSQFALVERLDTGAVWVAADSTSTAT